MHIINMSKRKDKKSNPCKPI
uniref:Uncharacterized protein n=1 Tax=Anguilla anguilla TaxID=7936 RepID=A0A0E9QHP9_ANGAN